MFELFPKCNGRFMTTSNSELFHPTSLNSTQQRSLIAGKPTWSKLNRKECGNAFPSRATTRNFLFGGLV